VFSNDADALKRLAGEFMKQNPDIQVEIVLLSLHHFERGWSRPKTGVFESSHGTEAKRKKNKGGVVNA